MPLSAHPSHDAPYVVGQVSDTIGLCEAGQGFMHRLEMLRGWRERWSSPETRPIARRLASELVAGRVQTSSPFGLVEGRVDLRGLQVDLLSATVDPMYQRVSVESGHWDALDLSGAGLSSMNWMRLRVTDCALTDAQLDDLRCWGIEVADCVARSASLRYAQIGAYLQGYPRSSWRRVDLQGADLRQLHGNVLLEDVDLSRAKFGRTNLGCSDLNRVRFRGTVAWLIIGGGLPDERRPPVQMLRQVDLSEAKPRELSLVGINLGTPEVDIRLPDDEEHWLIRDWPAFLDRVTAAAPDDLRRDVELWVGFQRQRLGPHQAWGFTTLRDSLKYGGQPFADLLRSSR
jgi:uncharacterized protein YjbI with pentapeptide repeats